MYPLAFEQPTRVLVTGASGYIGGLLVPALLNAGAKVRVLIRRAQSVADRSWAKEVDVVVGDAASDDLRSALNGIDVAYYLLHSMGGSDDFVQRDRELATKFARSAEDACISRIVYLGGLRPTDRRRESAHLASRAEVGRTFLDSDVPAVVLQAGVVLGAGSASFDMLRYLSGRLPVMITPRWVHNRVQPIAIDDVIHYLVAAGCSDIATDRPYDVAGPDVLTYEDMMQRYAALAGLRRRTVLAVPVLTPALASRWVGTVTPVASQVARPLMGSLVHDVVAQEDDLAGLVPAPPQGRTEFDDAVRAALDELPDDAVARRAELSAAAVALVAVPAAQVVQHAARWVRSGLERRSSDSNRPASRR